MRVPGPTGSIHKAASRLRAGRYRPRDTPHDPRAPAMYYVYPSCALRCVAEATSASESVLLARTAHIDVRF